MGVCEFPGCGARSRWQVDNGKRMERRCQNHLHTAKPQPMNTNDALSLVLTAIERLADQIAEVDARLSAMEGAETAGGIPDWARQDYFCGER